MSNSTQSRASDILPEDASMALLVGRAWRPDCKGPAIVALRDDQLIDITSKKAPTVSDLLALENPVEWVRNAPGETLGRVDDILSNSDEAVRDPAKPWLLAPIDLQAVKAAGVTFIESLFERVIEEQARGAPEKVAEIRGNLEQLLGSDLASIRPGSEQANLLKRTLVEQGLWSQYLEVGIGPDAEIFTKSQPMSAVGFGADIGIRPDSVWNNPEPEIALVASGAGRVVGATLCNDVNLRDLEGRSALLLGKAKDNNASCSVGPFVRLLDENFNLDDVRQARVDLHVQGRDGFSLDGASSMSKISRDPVDLVKAAMDKNHQYPDGLMLALGTMFVPVKDRGMAGKGFTHQLDDVVTISTRRIGRLRNRVKFCADCSPWTFGVSALMRNLAARELL